MSTAFAKMRKTAVVLCAVWIAAILLTACGSGNNGADSASDSSPADSETTAPADSPSASPADSPSPSPSDEPAERTLTDAAGHEVTVPTHPQRIIAPFLEDALTALGVKPVAQWSANGVPQKYLQDKLADVPTLDMMGGLKPEQTLSYSPDLIIFLAPTYVQEGTYDSFAKIAPSFVLSKDESDWRGTLQALGDLLGKTDEAKAALAQYDQKLADAKTKIHDAVGDKTAVLLQPGGEKGFAMFGPDFYSGEVLYGGLGFKQPAALKGSYDTYSLETLADLKDVDYLFVLSGEGRAEPPVDNPLWKSLPAVKEGRMFKVDSGHWFNANVIANGLIIDDVLNDVVK